MLLHQKVFVLRSRDRLGGVISNNAQPLFVCFISNRSSTGALGLTLNLYVTPAYPYQMTQTKYTCGESKSESLFGTCNIPHVAQPSRLFAQISWLMHISANRSQFAPRQEKIFSFAIMLTVSQSLEEIALGVCVAEWGLFPDGQYLSVCLPARPID